MVAGIAGKGHNPETMDVTILIVIGAVALPVLIVWALSKSAALRGPMPPARQPRPEPVEMLVTDAIQEEPPEDDDFTVEPDRPADPRGPGAGL
jgi:hypothetical protein